MCVLMGVDDCRMSPDHIHRTHGLSDWKEINHMLWPSVTGVLPVSRSQTNWTPMNTDVIDSKLYHHQNILIPQPKIHYLAHRTSRFSTVLSHLDAFSFLVQHFFFSYIAHEDNFWLVIYLVIFNPQFWSFIHIFYFLTPYSKSSITDDINQQLTSKSKFL